MKLKKFLKLLQQWSCSMIKNFLYFFICGFKFGCYVYTEALKMKLDIKKNLVTLKTKTIISGRKKKVEPDLKRRIVEEDTNIKVRQPKRAKK